MKPCPRCDAEIGESATGCKCGWRDRAKAKVVAAPRHIQCAHATCPISATIRFKLKTGWADLCYQHYIIGIRREQDERMDAKGFIRGSAVDLARSLARKQTSYPH